jgi:hypothetical protein
MAAHRDTYMQRGVICRLSYPPIIARPFLTAISIHDAVIVVLIHMCDLIVKVATPLWQLLPTLRNNLRQSAAQANNMR